MYKFDVAINIRNIDWEVFGKNDVFFDRSSCFRYFRAVQEKKVILIADCFILR